MKDNTYITIQSWMRTELDLSGNDLLVYAIIYGFSQDGQSKFNGSLQYLADWCGATKQGIQKNLKNLLDRGLIIKEESMHGNIKYCKYSCIPCNYVVYHATEFNEPMQHSCINNIDNKKNNNIDNNIDTVGFFGSAKIEKPKKKSLYDQCIDYVDETFDDIVLRENVKDWINFMFKIYREQGKTLYLNVVKSKINRLLTFKPEDRITIVLTAIDKGWQNFYEPKSYNKKSSTDVFGEDENVTSTVNRKETFSGESF